MLLNKTHRLYIQAGYECHRIRSRPQHADTSTYLSRHMAVLIACYLLSLAFEETSDGEQIPYVK